MCVRVGACKCKFNINVCTSGSIHKGVPKGLTLLPLCINLSITFKFVDTWPYIICRVGLNHKGIQQHMGCSLGTHLSHGGSWVLTRFLLSRSEHAPQGGGDVVACERSGHHHSHTLSQRIAWRGLEEERIDVNLSLSLSYILSLFVSLVKSLSISLVKSLPPSFSFIFHMCTHCIYVYILLWCNVNPPAVCLETGVQSDQEGMVGGLLKHILLSLDPVNVLYRRWYISHKHTFCQMQKGIYGVLQTVHIYTRQDSSHPRHWDWNVLIPQNTCTCRCIQWGTCTYMQIILLMCVCVSWFHYSVVAYGNQPHAWGTHTAVWGDTFTESGWSQHTTPAL